MPRSSSLEPCFYEAVEQKNNVYINVACIYQLRQNWQDWKETNKSELDLPCILDNISCGKVFWITLFLRHYNIFYSKTLLYLVQEPRFLRCKKVPRIIIPTLVNSLFNPKNQERIDTSHRLSSSFKKIRICFDDIEFKWELSKWELHKTRLQDIPC